MDQNLKGFATAVRGLPMPELRKDPIVGRWVIIATDRAKRPVAPKSEPMPTSGLCPFCEGNEQQHHCAAKRSESWLPFAPSRELCGRGNRTSQNRLVMEETLQLAGEGLRRRVASARRFLQTLEADRL